jgi:hypothetical protein
MSGGGGSDYGRGVGGGGGSTGGSPVDDGTDCGDLNFVAVLQSLQTEAVDGLTVGDLLEVGLRDGSPPVIEVRTTAGILVGALIQRVPELLRCLQRGVGYTAAVLSLDGGYVRVEVRPA